MMDAATAIGIIERKGIAKVRHIDVYVLWLQEVEARRKLPLVKVAGLNNMSDLVTKNVDQKLTGHHLTNLAMTLQSGRANTASQVTSVEPVGGTCDMKGDRRSLGA